MSVLVRFTPDAATKEQYDETIRRLEEAGHWPADGCESHVCFEGPGDSIRVSEIWDSVEKFHAHGEHLMPILSDVGIQVGPPEFLKVLQITRRSSWRSWK